MAYRGKSHHMGKCDCIFFGSKRKVNQVVIFEIECKKQTIQASYNIRYLEAAIDQSKCHLQSFRIPLQKRQVTLPSNINTSLSHHAINTATTHIGSSRACSSGQSVCLASLVSVNQKQFCTVIPNHIGSLFRTLASLRKPIGIRGPI